MEHDIISIKHYKKQDSILALHINKSNTTNSSSGRFRLPERHQGTDDDICYKFVERDGPILVPSPNCCATMKDVNVPCVCSYLGSPSVRDTISLGKDRVFYVTKQCGINIPGNCGCEHLHLIRNS
ncbi:hypothetical protein ABZP36_011045 [Zizania latifolia]